MTPDEIKEAAKKAAAQCPPMTREQLDRAAVIIQAARAQARLSAAK